MRECAAEIITAAAVASGLLETSVMDIPDAQSMLLPTPRVEMEYMPENMTRSFKRIARFPKPGDEARYIVIRERIYKTELTVRAVVRSKDEAWLAGFVRAFLVALPGSTADGENNLVMIKASRAVRGGFKTKMVEVDIKKMRSNTLHIVFSGMICRDREVALIRSVDVQSGLTIG